MLVGLSRVHLWPLCDMHVIKGFMFKFLPPSSPCSVCDNDMSQPHTHGLGKMSPRHIDVRNCTDEAKKNLLCLIRTDCQVIPLKETINSSIVLRSRSEGMFTVISHYIHLVIMLLLKKTWICRWHNVAIHYFTLSLMLWWHLRSLLFSDVSLSAAACSLSM